MRIVFSLILVGVSSFVFAQSLQQKVDRFANDYSLRHANLSICVLDIANHSVVADYRSERVAIPASTLKLVTTATALSVVGPDFQFLTEIQYDGTLSATRLNGNLWIKGSGDPTLGSTSLENTLDWEALLSAWADQVGAKGIKAVTGSVIGDGSYFDSYGAVASWQWADIGNYYGSDARGLNFNENKYTLYFDRKTQIGRTPRIVRLEPEIPWIEWVNEVKLAGPRTGDQAYIYGGPYTYLRYVRGTIPLGQGLFDIDGAIPDPPMVAARCFRLALEKNGVTIGKGERVVEGAMRGANRKTLFKHTSPPLSVIVDRTNQRSVNLYAEALIKLLGKRLGKEGSTRKGTDMLLNYWSGRGVATEGIQLYDGSGLSTRNSISARFLAEVLRKVSLDKKTFPVFLASIPKAGRTGSLSTKFKGSAAEGNLYAKSGTISGVRSYAGYFTGKDGRLYAFAILVNHYTSSGGSMRIKLDRLLTSFCE